MSEKKDYLERYISAENDFNEVLTMVFDRIDPECADEDGRLRIEETKTMLSAITAHGSTMALFQVSQELARTNHLLELIHERLLVK